MLSFRSIRLEDRAEIERCTKQINTYLCEHCFVDLYIWRDHYHTEVCFTDDFLLIRCQSFPDGEPLYLAPIGTGNPAPAVALLEQDAKERGVPFVLTSITEEMFPWYQENMPQFAYSTSEDAADYIYLSEKLQTLSGKKLQSKRNLINRFQAAYEGRWLYEPITPENTQDVLDYHYEWCKKNGCDNNDSFLGEACAIRISLDNFEALGLKGGILRLDGKIIAYTFGCKARDDLFIVQIEKAEHDIAGAYQMINQQFVKANCTDVMYVNREEDLGLEGLRKAKRSYYPVMYGHKYTAIPKKDVTI